MRFCCFRVKWGWIALTFSDGGLVRMTFPASDEQAAIYNLSLGAKMERREDEYLMVKNALLDYFNGKPADFDFPLDLACFTSFQRNVWDVTRQIPYGHLRSYGWVAAEIGRPHSARAVGQALGANPLPIIIPCHRVVRSDGSLGGFSGGLDWKKCLICLEKAVFTK